MLHRERWNGPLRDPSPDSQVAVAKAAGGLARGQPFSPVSKKVSSRSIAYEGSV
jgi:hypothetical protein